MDRKRAYFVGILYETTWFSVSCWFPVGCIILNRPSAGMMSEMITLSIPLIVLEAYLNCYNILKMNRLAANITHLGLCHYLAHRMLSLG